MSGKYDDMLELPHHVSEKRPRMPAADRAAQFSPFAALTGYGAVIAETGRPTDTKAELCEYEAAALNDKLNLIRERILLRPAVTLTYFRPDERKAGGAYLSVAGVVKKLDAYKRIVVLEDGTKLPIDDIVKIELE